MGAAATVPTMPHERVQLSQPGERENAATRLFRAPIDRVFRVFTEPAYAPSMWSQNPADVQIEEMDVRPGGRFSVVVTGSDGSKTRFFGEYREIVPPRLVVNTFHVSSLPAIEVLETDRFETVGEFTRLSVRWTFDSRESRDQMYGPNLEAALNASWDRLEGLLGTVP